MINKIQYGDNGDPGFISKNPTSPCPDSPNCVRLSLKYDIDVDELMTCAEITLKTIGGVDILSDYEKHLITCVFNVFIFKDDVTVYCGSYGSASLLHVKSSSRVGYSDLGVNKRRVKKFIHNLDLLIKEREKDKH